MMLNFNFKIVVIQTFFTLCKSTFQKLYRPKLFHFILLTTKHGKTQQQGGRQIKRCSPTVQAQNSELQSLVVSIDIFYRGAV